MYSIFIHNHPKLEATKMTFHMCTGKQTWYIPTRKYYSAMKRNEIVAPTNSVWRFLRKVKVELPYDPAIPLLGINPDKTIIQKDAYTPMFITALFTIANTWKQPKCPSTDEWIKKMWYLEDTVGEG